MFTNFAALRDNEDIITLGANLRYVFGAGGRDRPANAGLTGILRSPFLSDREAPTRSARKHRKQHRSRFSCKQKALGSGECASI